MVQIEKFVKKLLKRNAVQNTANSLLSTKNIIEMLVEIIQYKSAGESTVESSLWEKERIELSIVW